jgi:hypothetical protein
MKILYIFKQEPVERINQLIEAHKKKADVSIIDMRENKNYVDIIDAVVANDKVITW